MVTEGNQHLTGKNLTITYPDHATGKNFVITGDEVDPLIRALRAGGIEVTAVHSHMLNEQPRLFFVHFWANDDAVKLAKGIRSALDKTAVARG